MNIVKIIPNHLFYLPSAYIPLKSSSNTPLAIFLFNLKVLVVISGSLYSPNGLVVNLNYRTYSKV